MNAQDMKVAGRAVLVGCLMALAVVGCGGSGGSSADVPGGGGGTGGGGGSGTGGGSGGGGGGSGTGGGGSGGGTAGQPILYVADEDEFAIYELYMVDSGNPGASVKVSAPLTPGGIVDVYQISPGGTAVAYIADQDELDKFELYLVNLAQPGQSVKLNAPLQSDRDVLDFTFNADGSQVAYRADQDADGIPEVYLVGIASPGVSGKLNAPLTAGGWVRTGFSFNADGTHFVYRADQEEIGVPELYLVDVAVPGVSTQVNPPLVAGGSVAPGFSFSPDGMQIGYIADQDTHEMFELYVVATTMPGTASKLSGPMIPNGDVCRFRFSHDSEKVAYCADQETDGVLELYAAEISSPGAFVKLNPELPAGGEVTTDYEFSPDSSAVAFIAELDTANVDELYLVELASPGVAIKLSAPLTDGGDVKAFHFNSDGTRLAYIADQDIRDIYELYGVESVNPGVTTKLSAAQTIDGVYDFKYSTDDAQVFYIAAEDSESVELYRVDLANPRVSTRLNGTLVGGGEVWEFDVVE